MVPWTLASGNFDQLKLFNGLLGCGTFFLMDSVRVKAGATKIKYRIYCLILGVSKSRRWQLPGNGAFGTGGGGGGAAIFGINEIGGGGGGGAETVAFGDPGVVIPFVPVKPEIF